MPGTGSTPTAWEYLQVEITTLNEGQRNDKFYTLGIQGWQLVSVTVEKVGLFGLSSKTTAYFSRKLS